SRWVAVAEDCVDAQIERRAARQRHALARALLAEDAGEIGIEPFRIVAGDPRRGAGEVGGVEPGLLRLAQRRWCEARAVGKGGDRRAIELALEPQHAEHRRAWALILHDVAARGAPAQRVVDQ